MSLFHLKKSKITQNIFIKTTLLVLIPVLILSIVLYGYIWNSLQKNKERLQADYFHAIKSAAIQSENDVSNIINYIETIAGSPEILSYLQQDIPNANEGLNCIKKINDSLTNRFSIVDSAILYNRHQKICISSTEVTSSDTFFRDIYSYEDYDAKYWNKYNYFYSSLYQYNSLSPSLTTVNNQKKFIQPIIFLQIGDAKIKSFLIVNISFDALIDKVVGDYDLGDETFIVNNHSAKAFNAASRSTINIANTPLYNNLVQNKSVFDYNDGSKKYYVVSYAKSNTLTGYTYFSMIPYSQIYKEQLKGLAKTLLFVSFIILITIFVTLKIGNALTTPLKNIAEKLNPDDDHKKIKEINLIDSINRSIDNINMKNSKFDMLLPYMQEKYLIDFLNSDETTPNQKLNEILLPTLAFKYEYFSAIIIQLYPLTSFYEKYNSIAINNIRQGFYSVVKEIFSGIFSAYTLSTEKDILYIIVNSEDPVETEEKISNILSELNNLLKSDSEEVSLIVGIGKAYKGFDGLKQSHLEALNSLNAMSTETQNVLVNIARNPQKTASLSPREDENLTNYLMTFNYQSAIDTFNGICEKTKNLDERSQKQVFSQMLHIIAKVMWSKNMTMTNGTELDFTAISEILNKPTSDVKKELLVLLSQFKTNYDLQNPTADGITAYLQNEYKKPDLSLQEIADVFSISKSYVSSILKKHLGVTFHEYLTFIRINEAKKLLLNTDMSIIDIGVATGFASKQTFSRVFKASTGMTALEYRKKCKEN